MGITRREFMVGAGAMAALPALAFDSAEETLAALKKRDRAVLVLGGGGRDPFIALGRDGWYYYTGTMQMPDGADGSLGGVVRLFRSRDLATWEGGDPIASLHDSAYYKSEREVFDRTPLKSQHLWAPELHQREDGRWAIIFTVPGPLAPKVGAGLLLSAGKELHGPWTSPMGTNIGERHDPSLFRDDDGTWWVIWTNTKIQPLKKDWSGYAAEPTILRPAAPSTHLGHEGCLILKIEDKYVLFGTGWSVGHRFRYGSYNLYYCVADKVTGPYGPRKFAGRFLGHGTPFLDKQGKWWCTAFFNADAEPLPAEGIEKVDLREKAQTINGHGLTLVPMDIRKVGNDVVVKALDPHYATPGPDEADKWVDDNVAGWHEKD